MLLSRRAFLARFGGTAAATAAVYALPEYLKLRGLWNAAWAQSSDLVLDTYNGLAAMAWPGSDAYSVAQGESADRPGAIAANAGAHILAALDFFVPAPDTGTSGDGTVPLSTSVATAMNSFAVQVNAASAAGTFLAPFSNLSFADKAETWRQLEEETPTNDPSNSAEVLKFVFGVLPGFVQFFAFSEIDVFDPATRTLTRRPVGWDHARYLGNRLEPVEGWDEFIGYYQNRKEVSG